MSLKIESLNEAEHSMSFLNGLVDKIWTRSDTLLLVVGANPCLRAVYLKAIETGKLKQFSHCALTKMDYTLGRAEEKIKNKLLELTKLRKKVKIFIYLSCMEIVTAVDLTNIISEIEDYEKDIKIFPIKRGPMVKRHFSAKTYLEEIFENFVSEEEPIEHYEEPVFAGETEIVLCSLEYSQHRKCILQPGGCISCIKRGNYKINKDNIYTTRFNDLDMTFGLENKIVKESKAKFLDKKNIIFFETLLPQVVGFNNVILEEYYSDNDLKTLMLSSEDGSQGFILLKKAYKFILEDYLKNCSTNSDKILICGYSTLVDYYQKIVLEEINELENKEKYIIELNNSLPSELLVTNLEGLILANLWKELSGIPYKIFYPKNLHFKLSDLCEESRILLVGEPIQILAYEKILKKIYPKAEVILSFYHSNIKLDIEIEKFFEENAIIKCQRLEDLIELIDDRSTLIADKQIFFPLAAKSKYKFKFVEMNYQWLSANIKNS